MRQPANDLMKKWLKETPGPIELVISNNDEMALGALAAVKEAELSYFPAIVGIDGTKAAIDAVDHGDLLGTVINSSKQQAETIINFAAAMKTNEDSASALTLIGDPYAWVPYEIYTRK